MADKYDDGQWVTYELWGRGTGVVIRQLGQGLIRVRFGTSEATVRTDSLHLRPATEDETTQARRVMEESA